MSKDEWKGDVVEKNHFLFGQTVERITGTRHANGKDSWVVVHELYTNRFLSYLITEKGVDTVPVQSMVGSRYPGIVRPVIGSMKISEDGKKIAAVNCHSILGFDLYDFDNTTGKISNPISVSISPDSSQFYGLEFSPNGSKLYLSDVDGGKLYQCDISQRNVDSIRASVQIIIDEFGLRLGALQLAPNGKIYCSSYDSYGLSVLHQPDSMDCQFERQTLYLGGRKSKLGLPSFISGNIGNPTVPFEVSIQAPKYVCEGDSLVLSIHSNTNLTYSTVWWSGPNSFSSQLFNPVLKNISANQSGYYTLTLVNDKDTTVTGVVIEVIQKPIVTAKGINFPNLTVGTTQKDSLFVKNSGKSPVEITSKIAFSSADIRIISPSSFPITIPPNDSVKVIIEFAPKSLIYYRDSLVITAENLCFASKISYSITGKGVDSIVNNPNNNKPKDTVVCVFSMPDTTAKIGDQNYSIPIYARHTGKSGAVKLKNLQFQVTIDGDVYLPRVASSFDIENRQWNNNEQTLTLHLDKTTLTPENQKIGSIRGSILLSSKDTIPVIFSNTSLVSDSNVVIIFANNGKIITNLMNEVCGKGLRLVSYYKPIQCTVYPNPVSDEITIDYYLPFDTRMNVTLYSSTGEKVASLMDSPHKEGEYSCTIALSDRNLVSGVYFMKIVVGTQIIVKQVILTR
jgi:archaellum component FlaG (FlaF/FlaG flagellin family)